MTMTTTTAGEAWAPNVVASFDPDDKLGEALIVQAATRVGEVEGDEPSLLVPYVSADPEADLVAEATAIDLKDVTTAQLAISTYKVAVVTRMSHELTRQPRAAERIANSLRRSVTRKADDVFLNNVTDPTGLLSIAGVPTAGDLGTDLWAAYDAVAAIEADGGEATHLLINPLDWAALAKIPQGTGSNASLLTDVHNAAERRLAGVSVIVHNAVTQGTALMLDRSEVVAALGPLRLARSEDAFFTMDAVGIRATWRIGWGVVRPARLQKLTVGAGA